jgi:predicted lipoprotein with Yx(FWY)xxD motif
MANDIFIVLFLEKFLMKLSKIAVVIAITAASAFASSAWAQAIKYTDGIMTDANGKTLYIFTKDTVSKSNCNGACLAAWPAFTAKPEAKPAGDLGIFIRDDGARQWSYKGCPLYYYIGDGKVGDKVGDKQGGVWFVLPPPGSPDSPIPHDRGQ